MAVKEQKPVPVPDVNNFEQEISCRWRITGGTGFRHLRCDLEVTSKIYRLL